MPIHFKSYVKQWIPDSAFLKVPTLKKSALIWSYFFGCTFKCICTYQCTAKLPAPAQGFGFLPRVYLPFKLCICAILVWKYLSSVLTHVRFFKYTKKRFKTIK